MKDKIHPEYKETTIACVCGEVIHTRSTKQNIHVDICSKCHPFYTGKQKLMDSAGRVERFQKKLEIQGVGFKAAVQGAVVNLSLGYSHPILYPIPAGIKVTVEENTKVTIEGASKEVVGRVASEIRSYYPPEPYKGKGVRYVGEKVIRKEGKTVQ